MVIRRTPRKQGHKQLRLFGERARFSLARSSEFLVGAEYAVEFVDQNLLVSILVSLCSICAPVIQFLVTEQSSFTSCRGWPLSTKIEIAFS